jgi:predicted metal-dependent hydrolase
LGRFIAGIAVGLLGAVLFTTSWGSMLLALGLGAFVWFLYRRDPYRVREEARRFVQTINGLFRELVYKIKGR